MVQRFRTLLAGFAAPPLARRILQASLLLGGLSMVAIGAVFLLGSSWSNGPQTSLAADESQAPPVTANLTPESGDFATSSAWLSRFAFSRAPTPTATLAPTATDTPTPAPPPPAAAAQVVQPELPASQPEEPPAASCPTAAMSGFALDLFNEANAQRIANGLSPLGANACVTYVAYLRSQDMAFNSYFSHTSPTGETAFSLMDSNAVPYGWAGENLARDNYPDAETVAVSIRDLMASPGHRENILSTNYTQMGVGFAEDGAGMKYYTMIFIGPP